MLASFRGIDMLGQSEDACGNLRASCKCPGKGSGTDVVNEAMSNQSDVRAKIVVIGGGSGISNILRGLKQHPADLTAIVTMFDSGGSSGVLRTEFGYPPFGDLRQCLLALGDDTQETKAIRDALAFRFGVDSSLNGHSVGNLLLAAFTSLSNDLEQALEEIGQVLRVSGKVVPVTLKQAELCAELEDGRVIHGESGIDLRAAPLPAIKRIYLDREVEANPRAIEAVMEADCVILGPGDLYTSILPNLLPNGMVEAIESCRATRLFVCNLMTKRGETDGYKASGFVREITRYLGSATLDWALVNTTIATTAVQRAYEDEGASFVEPDLEEVGNFVNGIVGTSLAVDEVPFRHDPDMVAAAILQVLDAGRLSGRTTNQGSSASTAWTSDSE